jgi:hypothetical protein
VYCTPSPLLHGLLSTPLSVYPRHCCMVYPCCTDLIIRVREETVLRCPFRQRQFRLSPPRLNSRLDSSLRQRLLRLLEGCACTAGYTPLQCRQMTPFNPNVCQSAQKYLGTRLRRAAPSSSLISSFPPIIADLEEVAETDPLRPKAKQTPMVL